MNDLLKHMGLKYSIHLAFSHYNATGYFNSLCLTVFIPGYMTYYSEKRIGTTWFDRIYNIDDWTIG